MHSGLLPTDPNGSFPLHPCLKQLFNQFNQFTSIFFVVLCNFTIEPSLLKNWKYMAFGSMHCKSNFRNVEIHVRK